MKILYFDVETTGKDAKINDIIQLAGIVEIDGEVKESLNFKMQPFSYETIVPEALEVNHTTLEEIKSYQDPKTVYREFTQLLSKYVDKFNKNDKFYPAGFNVNFDLGFLREFFIKNNDQYFGSWFNYRFIDPLPFFYLLESCNGIKLENYKLSTVCEHLKIAIDAHDALSDIEATRLVVKYVQNIVTQGVRYAR